MRRKGMNRLRDEDGQVMVLTVLCMAVLLGFVGFALDVGSLLSAKRTLQAAADSAAIAGADELSAGEGTADADSAALADARLNGFTNGQNGVTVLPSSPGADAPPASASFPGRYFEVAISQARPTTLMRLLGPTSTTVTARAVAALGNSSNCIYSLGSSGKTFNVAGNSNITMPKCGIVVNSNDPAAMTLTGTTNITAKSIGISGNYSAPGGFFNVPLLLTGIATAAGDPLNSLPPPPANNCSAALTVPPGVTITATPGCYNGINATGGTLNLDSGTYVVNGPLNISGASTVTGAGVTVDLLGTSSVAATSTLTLTAPTTGSIYDGVVLYQPPSNTNPLSLALSAASELDGTIYAPNAALNLTGAIGANVYTNLVVKSLNLTDVSMADYGGGISVSSDAALSSVRLVE